MIKKTLKICISIKNQRRPKVRIMIKLDAYTKESEVKVIKLEVSIVNKQFSISL